MQTYTLKLSSRESGKNAAQELRNKNAIGVVYGHGIETTPVQGDWQKVNSLLQTAGTSHIIQLEIDGAKAREAVLKDIDFDPVTNQMRHFDLYVVKKGEKIHAEVPVIIEGNAPAAQKGLLVHQLIDAIEVVTLPSSLPESFTVDISQLSEVGDSIYVSDLKIEEGVEISEDLLEQPIIKIDAPREEEEVVEETESVDADEIPSEHGGDEEGESESEDKPESSGQPDDSTA